MERQPGCPRGVAGCDRDVGKSGAAGELGTAAGAPAGFGGPVLAVDPKAVDVVGVDQFEQLRDHQLGRVPTEAAGHVGALHGGRRALTFAPGAVRHASGIDAGPIEVQLQRAGVPDAGVVDAEGDTEPARRLAVDAQRVLDHTGRGRADVSRPRRESATTCSRGGPWRRTGSSRGGHVRAVPPGARLSARGPDRCRRHWRGGRSGCRRTPRRANCVLPCSSPP